MHAKPQKRAGVDLYIVHKPIQLPRASTNNKKANKTKTKTTKSKTHRKTKQTKNSTKKQGKWTAICS